MIYNSILATPLFLIPLEKEPMLIVPIFCVSSITLPIIYGVPAYRTYKAIMNQNIQIINLGRN